MLKPVYVSTALNVIDPDFMRSFLPDDTLRWPESLWLRLDGAAPGHQGDPYWLAIPQQWAWFARRVDQIARDPSSPKARVAAVTKKFRAVRAFVDAAYPPDWWPLFRRYYRDPDLMPLPPPPRLPNSYTMEPVQAAAWSNRWKVARPPVVMPVPPEIVCGTASHAFFPSACCVTDEKMVEYVALQLRLRRPVPAEVLARHRVRLAKLASGKVSTTPRRSV